MNVKEAAAFIGCSPAHIRKLISTGKLKAKRKNMEGVEHCSLGYVWEIPKREAQRYRKKRFVVGWKRGRPRTRRGKQISNGKKSGQTC